LNEGGTASGRAEQGIKERKERMIMGIQTEGNAVVRIKIPGVD
jgi:hypothetical protein